jgi:hypothetical protein
MKKIFLLINCYCIWNLAGAQFVINTTNPNCEGECTGKAQITPMGAGNYNYKWSNGDTSYYTGNLCPGTYFCTVSNSLEEPIDTFTIVIFQPIADDLIVVIKNVSCEGGNDGVIEVFPTVPSLQPYIYGCNKNSFRFQYSDAFGGLDTGWYEILAINKDGCDTMIFAHVGEADTPCTTLINEINSPLNYDIWPNPTTAFLETEIQNPSSNSLQISIMDISGRILNTHYFNSDTKNEIDVSMLPSGIYFVRLQVGEQSLVRRFVKE